MERTTAIKVLHKLLGKGFGYRVDPKAPDAEEREAVKQTLSSLHEAKKKASEAVTARRQVLLQDPEYQRLTKAYKVAEKAYGQAYSRANVSYKFTAGIANGMFFHIKAQGDSWEEVIAKVKAGK